MTKVVKSVFWSNKMPAKRINNNNCMLMLKRLIEYLNFWASANKYDDGTYQNENHDSHPRYFIEPP